MKFKRTKDWYERRITLEGDAEVGIDYLIDQVQEEINGLKSQIKTLEAQVKAADEMEALLERVPFYTLDQFIKKYAEVIIAYRQAKERGKA